MDWFRYHHGTPSNTGLQMIAAELSLRRCEVIAVWDCLMDHASQSSPRGSINDCCLRKTAFISEVPSDDVKRIVAAMEADGMIRDGKLFNWKKHQPDKAREEANANGDESADERKRRMAKERKERFLERQRTLENANGTQGGTVGPEIGTPENAKERSNGGDYRGGDLDSDTDSERSLEGARARSDHAFTENEFKDFLKAYPTNGDSEFSARQAFGIARMKAPASDIIAGAAAYRDHRLRKPDKTLNASNWLAKQGWTTPYLKIEREINEQQRNNRIERNDNPTKDDRARAAVAAVAERLGFADKAEP